MRKEIEVKIEQGRDAGKVFIVKEMPAYQMDKWVTRALCMLSKNDDLPNLGDVSLENLLKSFAKMDSKEVEPLLNEMLACCSFKKDGVLIEMKNQDMIDSVVEDWKTIFRLRIEALKVNLDFLVEGEN